MAGVNPGPDLTTSMAHKFRIIFIYLGTCMLFPSLLSCSDWWVLAIVIALVFWAIILISFSYFTKYKVVF